MQKQRQRETEYEPIQKQKQKQVTPLIFIGGAKGVGKTTLITEANKDLGLPILHTGSLYVKARDEGEDIQQVLYENIARFVGIIDSHYAGAKGTGFQRGLTTDSVEQISRARPELKFVLITASLEEIVNRKIKDTTRERDVSKRSTEHELNVTFDGYMKYKRESGSEGIIIYNDDNSFGRSVTQLKDYIQQQLR